MGIVAHYYINVELQGILQAMKEEHSTSVAIADLVAMGDYAVKICKNGATLIAYLGVDFMVKLVEAILKQNGFPSIPMYQLLAKEIGCLLAASAETKNIHCKNLLQLKTLTEKL